MRIITPCSKFFFNYADHHCIAQFILVSPFSFFLKLLKHADTSDNIQLLYKAKVLPEFGGFTVISNVTFSFFFLSSREETRDYCSHKAQWSFMSLILHLWTLLWDHSALYSRTADNSADFFPPHSFWRIFLYPQ